MTFRQPIAIRRRSSAKAMLSALVGLLLLLTLFGGSAGAQAPLVLPAPEFETDYQRPELSHPLADGLWRDGLYVGALVLALAAAVWLVHWRRSRRGMAVLSIFSLAFFGFWLLGCICPIGSVQNIGLGLSDSSYILPWAAVAVFVLPLGVALVYGRVFCGGVCPLGAVQDVVLLRAVRVPEWLDKPLGLIPFAYLSLAVVLATTGGPFIICQYDPFIGLFRMSGEMWLIMSGLGLLLLGMFVARPYCRFLCPYGVLLGLCSSVTRRRVSTSPGQCVNCRLCEKACPMGAIRPATEERGRQT